MTPNAERRHADCFQFNFHEQHCNAEYWDVKESKMVQLAKMATAAVTGKQAHLGEHKELNLS